jgi:hypothetical protein
MLERQSSQREAAETPPEPAENRTAQTTLTDEHHIFAIIPKETLELTLSKTLDTIPELSEPEDEEPDTNQIKKRKRKRTKRRLKRNRKKKQEEWGREKKKEDEREEKEEKK